MNSFKHFLIGILTVTLTVLITVLVICLNLNRIVTNTLTDSLIKETLSNKVVNILSNNLDDLSDKDIDKIKDIIYNNDQLNIISNTYITEAFNYLTENPNLEDIAIKENLSDIIKGNKKVIEEKTNKTITDEQIDNILTDIDDRIDLNNIYKEQVYKLKNRLSDEQISAIKLYNSLTTSTTKIILISLIVIDLLLIALLKYNLYGWIINIGSSLTVSGILIVITSGILSAFANYLTKKLYYNIDFSRNNLFNSGIIITVVGIIIIIFYNILLHILKNKRLANN